MSDGDPFAFVMPPARAHNALEREPLRIARTIHVTNKGAVIYNTLLVNTMLQ